MLAPLSFLFASSLITTTLAATFTVAVGKDGTKFTPDFVRANQGDEIIFEFYPKNHTITQSTLAQPCVPIANGGDSGYIPVAADVQQRPTKRLVVQDSVTPLWFYCKQGTHCSKGGMVFAVNPKSDEQMAQYRANALVEGGAAPPSTSSTPPATPPTTSSVPPAPTDTNPTTPPPTGGREIQIAVGQGGALTFTPDRATAAVGDTLVLTFMAGAHTFTQSTFADPCSPMAGGIDSGSKPAANGPVNFTYTVTDASKPQWFYCKTGAHCKAGMVFSLNAPATGNTADAFKAAAMGNAPTGGAPTGGSPSNTTGSGPEQTNPDGGASSLVTGSFGLVIAAAIAGLLL